MKKKPRILSSKEVHGELVCQERKDIREKRKTLNWRSEVGAGT